MSISAIMQPMTRIVINNPFHIESWLLLAGEMVRHPFL
jgi:hypothetical protein